MQQTTDGGYIAGGYTKAMEDDFGKYIYGDAWLIRTDAEGNELWNMIFKENESSRFYSVAQTREGGYAAAGWLNLYDDGLVVYSGALLIKVKDTEANLSNRTAVAGGTAQKAIPAFGLLEAVLSVVLLFLLKRMKN